MEAQWHAGLMTGTVLDGEIDAALIRTDGRSVEEFGPFALTPYPREIRDLLEKAVDEARKWDFGDGDPESFSIAERALTEAQSDAAASLVQQAGLSPSEVAAVGFHGQTVLHRAPVGGKKGRTRQLGDGQLMADRLGIPVVYDLRAADVGAGGQGAPICSPYHAALLERIGAGSETAVLNLGGIANVTWQGPDGSLIAFDTGPANGTINDWVKSNGMGEMDRGGALAKAGRVDGELLARLLDHPYMEAPFPKSLDRFDFTSDMAAGCTPEDGAALLTAFAACAVGRGLDLLPKRPDKVVVCGGGRHNPALMEAIALRADVAVENADSLGWRGDAVEAECFAFLAARRVAGLPITFPGTTGVPKAMTGGRLANPKVRNAGGK